MVGTVAALPHRSEAGLRFRFEPESAHDGSRQVDLPPHILLGWYAGAEASEPGVLSLQRGVEVF